MTFLEALKSGYYSNPLSPYPGDNVSRTERFEMLEKYRAEMRRLQAEFRRDALEYHGLANHPKAEKIFAFAYDYTEGLNEMNDMLEEISGWFS